MQVLCFSVIVSGLFVFETIILFAFTCPFLKKWTHLFILWYTCTFKVWAILLVPDSNNILLLRAFPLVSNFMNELVWAPNKGSVWCHSRASLKYTEILPDMNFSEAGYTWLLILIDKYGQLWLLKRLLTVTDVEILPDFNYDVVENQWRFMKLVFSAKVVVPPY